MGSRDFIGEHLTNIALERDRLYRDELFAFLGEVRFNLRFFVLWTELVEIFF